jgi:hypothetical protein
MKSLEFHFGFFVLNLNRIEPILLISADRN